MSATTPELPAFTSVLKSRDVEDPVNLWLHRPLAYAIVALIYRTKITPNQVTLLALLVGLIAAACICVGTRTALLWGGALLWLSAILDGADGILARVRRQFSELGRAIDGTADMGVAAATALAAVYHLWMKHGDPWLIGLAPLTVVSALLHIYVYDHYKESFLLMTNPGWNGEPERVADIAARHASVKARGGSLVERVASRLHIDLIEAQTRLIARLDPWASREPLRFQVSAETVACYRAHNRRLMKAWALISLAPHSYLLAIAVMFDRIDLYLWARLLLGNLVFVVGLFLQRRASRRTREELASLGLAPLAA